MMTSCKGHYDRRPLMKLRSCAPDGVGCSHCVRAVSEARSHLQVSHSVSQLFGVDRCCCWQGLGVQNKAFITLKVMFIPSLLPCTNLHVQMHLSCSCVRTRAGASVLQGKLPAAIGATQFARFEVKRCVMWCCKHAHAP